jgi:hypothetical protein
VQFGISAPSGAKPQDKVTICHASNAVDNPYVQHTVNASSIVMPNGQPSGHGEHEGPVYPGEEWGDIIPPFEYANDQGGTSHYPGINWSGDGQAIWDAGCVVSLIEEPPIGEPAESTTTLPPTTTSMPTSTSQPAPPTTTHPSTTTTTHPISETSTEPEHPHVEPSTTVPTTVPPAERPPGITDPPNGAEITPPVTAEVIEPGGKKITLHRLDVAEREALEAELDPPSPPAGTSPPAASGPLAGTGRDETREVAAAGTLILAGLALLLCARWRRPLRHED